jgi:hypothetical protein
MLFIIMGNQNLSANLADDRIKQRRELIGLHLDVDHNNFKRTFALPNVPKAYMDKKLRNLII